MKKIIFTLSPLFVYFYQQTAQSMGSTPPPPTQVSQISTSPTLQPSFNNTSGGQTTLVTLHCPNINDLVLSPDRKWESKLKHWKSSQRSFTTKLSVFVGGQWIGQGPNIGQVICLYTVPNAQEMVTQLRFNTMVNRPTSGAWEAPPSLQYQKEPNFLNCVAHDLPPSTCSFTVRSLKKSTQSLKQQALGLQNNR